MQVAEFLSRLEGIKRSGAGWSARCPAHEDRNNSLSVGDGDKGIVIHCHAGCSTEEVLRTIGLQVRDLFPERSRDSVGSSLKRAPRHTPAESRDKAPASAPAHGLTVLQNEITLAEYAKDKGLSVEFLKNLGLYDRKRDGRSAVCIPYLDRQGRTIATRYRIAMAGDRFRWKTGEKPCLYGLWRIDDAPKAGHAVVVEGESDCHTAWFHNVPAVGLPGAANWQEDRDAQHFDGIDRIYVVVEPDNGGDAVLKWLSKSAIRDRAHLVDLSEHKDLSDLHLAAGDRFDELWQKALANAVPYAERVAKEAEAEQRRAFGACEHLINEPDILSKFSEVLSAVGVVGETKITKLLYLALTSRFLDRPISVVLKGPSSGGKSYTSEQVLKFFPEEAFYALTAMSDRALAYSEEPLAHRFIVIFEAAGLASDFATYLMRSLLSEGRLRYETVEKTSEGMKPRIIEREGPTGCLITTTAAQLHAENETRMLSLQISDTPAQTRAILHQLAEEKNADVDLTAWHALQIWLKGANHRVTIPYAKKLAEMVPEKAVRLRRDFKHVLTLIRAHAMLHQMTREVDPEGRIVASLEDYAAVYDLVADVISEGVEATVPPAVRETVEAVEKQVQAGNNTVTVKQVAEILRLDASAASRRVKVASNLGYLKNEETRPRMPAKLVIGDPLPEDAEILPHPDRLREGVHVCTFARGDTPEENAPEPISKPGVLANGVEQAQENGHVGPWSAEDYQVYYDERAAAAEFDGGLSRAQAEAQALEACVATWLDRNPTPSSPGSCLACRGNDRADDPVLPYGTEGTGHAWLHARCRTAWGAARRARAVAELAAMRIAAPRATPRNLTGVSQSEVRILPDWQLGAGDAFTSSEETPCLPPGPTCTPAHAPDIESPGRPVLAEPHASNGDANATG